MKSLMLNAIRQLKSRIWQYIGLILMVLLVVMMTSSVFASSVQITQAYNKVLDHSEQYSYRIVTDNLTPSANGTKIIKNEGNKYTKLLNAWGINPSKKSTAKDQANARNQDTVNAFLTDLASCETVYSQSYCLDETNSPLLTPSSNKHTAKYIFTPVKVYILAADDFNGTKDKRYFRVEQAFTPEYTPFTRNLADVYMPNKVNSRVLNTTGSIVINKRFAENNHLKLNQKIDLTGGSYKLAGYGYSANNINPDLAGPIGAVSIPINSNTTVGTTLWTNAATFKKLTAGSQKYFISSLVWFKDSSSAKIVSWQDKLTNYLTYDNFNNISHSYATDPNGGQANQSNTIQIIVFIAITIVAMIILLVVSGFFIRKEINKQTVTMGILKSMGYFTQELSVGFVITVCIAVLTAAFAGFMLSLAMQVKFNAGPVQNYALPVHTTTFIGSLFAVYVIVIPIVFSIFGFMIAGHNLKKPPLELLRNTGNKLLNSFVSVAHKLVYWAPFKTRVTLALAAQSFGKLIIVTAAFMFSSVLLSFLFLISDIFQTGVTRSFDILAPKVSEYLSIPASPYYNYVYTKTDPQGKVIGSVQNSATSYNWAHKYTSADKTDFPNATVDDFVSYANNFDFSPFEPLKKSNVIRTKKVILKPAEIQKGNGNPTTICKNIVNALGNLTGRQIFQAPEQLYVAGTASDLSGKPVDNNHEFLTVKYIYSYIEKYGQSACGALAPLTAMFSVLPKNVFPNFFFNYVVHQPPKDSETLKWSGTLPKLDINNPVYNIDALGLSDKNESYYNLTANKKQIDSVINQTSFDVNHPTTINAIVGQTIAQKMNLKIGDTFKSNINNVNNKTSTYTIKVAGINNNEIIMHQFFINNSILQKIVLKDVKSASGSTNLPNSVLNQYNNQLTISNKNLIDSNLSVYVPFLKFLDAILSGGDQGTVAALQQATPLNATALKISDLQEQVSKVFDTINSSLQLLKAITVIVSAIILLVIVSMIIDENFIVIMVFKVLGYRLSEILQVTLSIYSVFVVGAFIAGFFVAIAILKEVSQMLFNRIGFLLPVVTKGSTTGTIFGIIAAVVVVALIFGIFVLSRKRISEFLTAQQQ